MNLLSPAALSLLTAIAVAALLLCDSRNVRVGIWITKPLASTGFILVALAAGATDGGSYGHWVLLALVLSWWGDVLLIPEDNPASFRMGLLSFLLGHVAYVIAFTSRGFDVGAGAWAGALLVIPVLLTLRWLHPHVPRELVWPVRAYVAVITCMLISAAATHASPGGWAILIGASLFYVSDLAVARDRFVRPGFGNHVWGLPLYYGGQLVLAASVMS